MTDEYQIRDTFVPKALIDQARDVIRNGGKAFLAVPEPTTQFFGNCANCFDAGQLQLQIVVGGPFDSPTDSTNSSSVFMNINGRDKWFTVRTSVFRCPRCRQATF